MGLRKYSCRSTDRLSYVERTPHFLGDLLEGPLSALDLLIQDLTSIDTASVAIEEHMASILHEYGAIEV